MQIVKVSKVQRLDECDGLLQRPLFSIKKAGRNDFLPAFLVFMKALKIVINAGLKSEHISVFIRTEGKNISIDLKLVIADKSVDYVEI